MTWARPRRCRRCCRREGYGVDLAERGDDGLAQAKSRSFDLVLTDLKLPGLSGMELAAQLRAAKPKLPIIMMTAHGTTDTAIEATKLGAYEYLVKPFEADDLLDLVASAVAHSRLMSEPVEMGEARSARFAIIGKSRVMQSIYKEIGRVAATPATVLIRGATGTGKELIARAIYQHSDRADKPFIAVNCAAIPETLLESELFGHERGSFTGAQARRIGRFEQAHGGTIFLDEIGDLNANTQSKLLRVLQERCIQRLGGDDTIPVDVARAGGHASRPGNRHQGKGVSRGPVLPPERRHDPPAGPERAGRRHPGPGQVLHPPLRRGSRPRNPLHSARSDFASAKPTLARQRAGTGKRRAPGAAAGQALCHQPGACADRCWPKPTSHRPIASQTHAAYVADLLARVQRGEEQNAYLKMIADLEPELFTQAIRLAQGNQAKAARWLGVTRLKMREKLIQLGLHPFARELRERMSPVNGLPMRKMKRAARADLGGANRSSGSL